MNKSPGKIVIMLTTLLGLFTTLSSHATENMNNIRYKKEKVNEINIFYREAGDPSKQTVVLLHGFPSSSHQYRTILSTLGNEFHLIAPDYPGYGYSDKPDINEYKYTFDNLAQTMTKFLEQRKIKNYVLMIHDFGAPVGFRIAAENPTDVAGLVVMNGNAYEEGLSEMVRKSLKQVRSTADEEAKINGYMSLVGIQWMYLEGTRNPENISPDGWHLDHTIINTPITRALNLELLYDYPNNLKHYSKWQAYLREHQPPMLIVWGKNDPIFPEPGAAAYKKDVKEIDYYILDTGHFPLEEDADFIIDKMRQFLSTKVN